MNEVNAINPNVAVVENVAEMESVDVRAGADAATCGRPLIEVIDEGQVDLSSDGIGSFEDSSSSSSLTPIFSDPPSDFSDAMDESDSSPQDTSSPPSLPPPSGQVGSRYEGRSLCAKAKGSLGTASVRKSLLLKTLSGKHVLPRVVASKPKGSGLRRSASLAVAFNFLTLNVKGIRDPIKRSGLLRWLSHLSCDFVCLQETHVTDAAEAT